MNTRNRNPALEKLLRRRELLEAEYERLVHEPASYGVSGSVNATNRRLDEIRTEIADINRRVAALLGASRGGIRRMYPRYCREGL